MLITIKYVFAADHLFIAILVAILFHFPFHVPFVLVQHLCTLWFFAWLGDPEGLLVKLPGLFFVVFH